jgi:PAS domain S-box-containing protein
MPKSTERKHMDNERKRLSIGEDDQRKVDKGLSLRILYLEDDRNDVELVQTRLEEEGFRCDLTHVETRVDFISALEKDAFDIILADYKLPSFDGLSALAIAREKTPDAPFIFVSGAMGEELAIETLKNGATDYVLKQRISRLIPAVQRALREAEEHSKRAKAEEEIKKYQAHLEELVKERTTELSIANEHLSRSEIRYRVVADNTRDWEYWVNPEGEFLYSSPSCKQTTGYDVEEFTADPDLLTRIVRPDDRSFFIDHQREVEGKMPGEMEFRIVHPDGTYRWISHVCQPVFDDGGRFLGTRGSNRDVTKRREAEEALKRVSDNLERSNTELQQIVFGVAHDLLNPLNIIAGCIYLFEQRYKGKMGAQFDELLKYSSIEFYKVKKFVQDLLTYAKVGTDSQDFNSVDLSSVVDKAMDNLQEDIKESGVVVKHDHLPVVVADEIQMIRLFQNLISNAIKYRRKKSPKIYISADRGKDEWVFSVKDNGIGIEEKNFERIFMIFQRLHAPSGHQGSGIGLAICKKIVECHGGRLWVESKIGKGSTFHFTIPDRG